MPKNLRHEFRSELIKQRKSGLRTSRNEIKKAKGGKMADYRHIYSDNSYKKHLSRAQRFADYCKQNGVKNFAQITPEFAQKYLEFERDKSINGYSGYSASTIASDALMINHIMIGSNHWREADKLVKSKITGMPHRSTKIATQRQKPLASSEWVKRYPHTYNAYKSQITALRAFGLRRRELVGGTSKNGSDGLGDRSLYEKNGHIWAITQGKGGKIRWTACRQDLENEIKQEFHGHIRPWSERPRSKADFKHNLKFNQPFYKPYSHNVPTHIFRAEYAQHMITQLNHADYSGQTRQKAYYARAGRKPNGKFKYIKKMKTVNLEKCYQIGGYKAQYGAFYRLSELMGHNRIDVLQCYLGEGH